MTIPAGRLHAHVRKIVVVNPKGGSGKTTVATNLAAYFACHGVPSALMDRDQQGSSRRWHSKRDPARPAVHLLSPFHVPANVTRTFAMRLPEHIEWLIIDTAAAMSKHELAEITRDAHKVIVPVLPSELDIHAAARTIADLLLVARLPRHAGRLSVVANRVKRNTRVFRSLMRFLATLNIPVAAVLRDAQSYIRAVENGLGVHELEKPRAPIEVEQWEPLVAWLAEDQVDDVPVLTQQTRERADAVAEPRQTPALVDHGELAPATPHHQPAQA